MKYILLTLSLIAMSSFRDDFITEFDEKVSDAYEEYRLLGDEYSGVNYAIKVYYGVFNDKVYYAICFYNETPKDYQLRIELNNKLYRLETNSRNDVQVVALSLKSGDVFSLVVYDKNNIRQSLGTDDFKNIKVFSPEEFSNLSDLQQGQGNGIKTAKLLPLRSAVIPPLGIIAIVAAVIIIACVLVILIYYKKRKGMFSESERKKNVFNFKEFILSVEKSLQEKENELEEYFPAEAESLTEDENSGEAITGTYAENYVPHYSWARDEDVRSDFNIKKHLQELGFITDYRIIDSEEKNKIMLELMRLKEQKTITQDDYLYEVSELWKKSE